MGCDIHMYIQYANKERLEEDRKNGNEGWWMDFGGRINPDRDYGMFGTLAGVRYAPDNEEKMFYPKGVPDFGLGWSARGDLFLRICDDGSEPDENECTLDNAKRWGGEIINGSNGKPYKTYHPDWHSHSWLTIKELSQAYRWYQGRFRHGPGVEWKALLNAMKALEDGGKNEVIVVFWFDN